MVLPETLERKAENIDNKDQKEVILIISEIQRDFYPIGLSIDCPRQNCNNNNITIEEFESDVTVSLAAFDAKQAVTEMLASLLDGSIPVGTGIKEFSKVINKEEYLTLSGFDVPEQPVSNIKYIRCPWCEEEGRFPDIPVRRLRVGVPVMSAMTPDETKEAYEEIRGTELREIYEFSE